MCPSVPDCSVRWSGEQVIATLPARLDVSNADAICLQMMTVLGDGARTLIADMTRTTGCDYAGTEALAHVYRRAVSVGTELRLAVTAPAVRRALSINGLDRLIGVYPNLRAALAARPVAVVVPLRPRDTRLPDTPPDALADAPPRALPRLVQLMPRLDGHATQPAAASPDGTGSIAQAGPAGVRPPAEDMVTAVIRRIFDVALLLTTAVSQPPAMLRRSVDAALLILDQVVRDLFDMALAGRGDTAGSGPADGIGPAEATGYPSPGQYQPRAHRAAVPPPRQSRVVRREASQRLISWSRELHSQTLQALTRSAEAFEGCALTLNALAASGPQRSPRVTALSDRASGLADDIRRWIHRNAANA